MDMLTTHQLLNAAFTVIDILEYAACILPAIAFGLFLLIAANPRLRTVRVRLPNVSYNGPSAQPHEKAQTTLFSLKAA